MLSIETEYIINLFLKNDWFFGSTRKSILKRLALIKLIRVGDKKKKSNHSPAHTRVPNLISDIVCPLLEPSERDCLLYIVRRTYGFADPDGGRKTRDTISLEQFEKGIVSGSYLLDLGTGLTKNTIKKALKGLESKDLIEIRPSCLKCFWESDLDRVSISKSTGAPECPRCHASLSSSYSISDLTPKKILNLLNQYDPQKRSWSWQPETGRFIFVKREDEIENEKNEDVRAEAKRLRSNLWYPELVDQAAKIAGARLKSGEISIRRRLNNFYRPVWEFQEEYSNPALIKYALEQTIKSGVFRNPNNQRWHRYMRAVLENQQEGFTGQVKKPGHEERLKNHEKSARELLRRAAKLNGLGQEAEARSILSDILGQTKNLTPLFENETECDNSIREAFKRGEDYFVGIRPLDDDAGQFDFYPEWQWPK